MIRGKRKRIREKCQFPTLEASMKHFVEGKFPNLQGSREYLAEVRLSLSCNCTPNYIFRMGVVFTNEYMRTFNYLNNDED